MFQSSDCLALPLRTQLWKGGNVTSLSRQIEGKGQGGILRICGLSVTEGSNVAEHP